MGVRTHVFALCGLAIVAVGSGSVGADDGPDPCVIRQWDSVDNGMGAEPSVFREFAAGISIPGQCLLNGLDQVVGDAAEGRDYHDTPSVFAGGLHQRHDALDAFCRGHRRTAELEDVNRAMPLGSAH